MANYKINTTYKKRLADTTTPVSIYLRLRDVFPNTILLESSDYHSRENSVSYVCADPVAGILLKDGKLSTYYPGGLKQEKETFATLLQQKFKEDAEKSLKGELGDIRNSESYKLLGKFVD